MRQYKLCIKIIIIIIKEKKSIKVKWEETEGEKEGVGYFIFFIISSLRFFLISTKIGQQVFIGTEGKVDLRDESYVWTPKSWSFDKLREVGVLSYLKLHFI